MNRSVGQREIEGDLFTQVDKTVDFLLTKYLKATISYEGIQRVNRPGSFGDRFS